ncbi:MAG TPA: DUF4040 domain-containing protein [Thermococcus paralvinellae]|uniref:DUF4040 domain-containing protein n=1 Tax=Thermococcus paralvinellae TaxID=582419 RepID=A0A832ZDM6_9EURY|nr:DUF4040 domain-containing protein [Thermococcus paralvinellae]
MIQLAALSMLSCAMLMYLIVTENDLLKAVVYLAVSGSLILITFYILMAPDIVLAYAAISIVLSTGLMVFLVSKTGRYEVV